MITKARTHLKQWLTAVLCIVIAGVVVILCWSSNAVKQETPALPDAPLDTATAPPAVVYHTSSDDDDDPDTAARKLLTQYELSRNPALLLEAQLLYPTSLAVIRLSAIEATSPDSEHLMMLELLEPNNALPHMIRAGLYAKTDPASFLHELDKMVAKEELFSDSFRRTSDALNVAMEKSADAAIGYLQNPESPFYKRFSDIYHTLVHRPELFDSPMDNYKMVHAYTEQLKTDDERDFSLTGMADLLKIDAILHIDEATSSTTLADSLAKEYAVLEAKGDAHLNDFEKVRRQVFGKKAKPEVREQFLRIMADQGEQAAVNWLLGR